MSATDASREAQPSDSRSTLDTWPFWAPSQAAAVDAALDLAGLAEGERLLDLGCGDGQVLAVAARRGVTVAGIEADADLVAEAGTQLRAAGVDADVVVGDLLDPGLELDADVFFAYLAPATLQRLHPVLAGHRGRRLVTVDFAVPGLVPTRRADPARLYVLPGRRRPVGEPGWPSAGTLVATVPDCQSLSCLELVHPGGPTRVRLSHTLGAVATSFAGADHLDAPAHLAVDLRWEPMPEGTVVGGAVRAAGVEEHAVFVIATDDEDEGMWELTAGAVDALRAALRRRNPPGTVADLLTAATA